MSAQCRNLVALFAIVLSSGMYGQSLDVYGNLVGPTGPALQTVGAVISSFSTPSLGPHVSDIDSWNGSLIAVSGYAGFSGIAVFDPLFGGVLQTIPTGSSNDFGVAFDSYRNYFVTTNVAGPTNSVVKVYDGVTSSPLATYPVAQSATGIGYDSVRDLYWFCGAFTNLIFAMQPTTGAITTTYSTASFGCTRPAGVSYDQIHDVVLVGGRDQNAIFAMNPATGGLVWSVPAAGGTNVPQGVAAFQTGSSVWGSGWNFAAVYQVETVNTPTLSFNVSVPGYLTVQTTSISGVADRRLFADIITGPYTASGPFAGASISLSQILVTLNWPTGAPPFSTLGPATTATFGPFPLPSGITLNAVIVDFVSGVPYPPLVAAGGTVL